MYHTIWMWLWFVVGILLFMLKRAYFLVKGPQPVADTYHQFFVCAWIPLLIRFGLDCAIFWMTFVPALLAAGLQWLGWNRFAAVIDSVTQYGFFAFFFGYGVDSMLDFIVTKVPFVRDMLPQMPPSSVYSKTNYTDKSKN